MAEEVLVSTQLSNNMVNAGEKLIKMLDNTEASPSAAFWFCEPDPIEWKFILASPLIKSKGPNAYYEIIQNLNASLSKDDEFLPLNNIWLATEENDLVKLISSVISTDNSISKIRLNRTYINGHSIDGVYIYRMNLQSKKIYEQANSIQ